MNGSRQQIQRQQLGMNSYNYKEMLTENHRRKKLSFQGISFIIL